MLCPTPTPNTHSHAAHTRVKRIEFLSKFLGYSIFSRPAQELGAPTARASLSPVCLPRAEHPRLQLQRVIFRPSSPLTVAVSISFYQLVQFFFFSHRVKSLPTILIIYLLSHRPHLPLLPSPSALPPSPFFSFSSTFSSPSPTPTPFASFPLHTL